MTVKTQKTVKNLGGLFPHPLTSTAYDFTMKALEYGNDFDTVE